MNEQNNRYTAQELRQTAEMDFHVTKLGLDDRPDLTDEIRAMLRQAADTEEELAELRDQVNRDFGESVSLKARLETIVKECEKMRDGFSKRMRSFTGMFALNMRNIYMGKIEIVDDILRTARGESDSDNSSSYTDDVLNT